MRQLRHQPDSGSATRGGRRVNAIVVLGTSLLFACSGAGDDEPLEDASATTTTTADDEALTTTTEAPSTSPATTAPAEEEFDSVEEEIVARYEGYWDARFAANSPPDPDAAALREYATGAQLDQVIAETQANLTAGVEFRRSDDPINFRIVTVASLNGDSAVVQECVVNDNLVVRNDSGAVVDGTVATYNVRGDMVRVDGEWRLESASQLQRWEGVAGCALAD